MNDFILLEQVGQGAFGRVFKAKHKLTKELSAAKIVTCSAPEGVDLALSEMWALSQLTSHPNVIKFNGAYLETNGQFELLKHGDKKSSRYRRLVECCLKGEFLDLSNARENTRLWFMTEFCSAGDLNRYIIEAQEKKTKTQNTETNAQISLQLLEGLKFLHQHDVVHRDLKPENVLVSLLEDNSPIVKIADFGLSRVLTSTGSRCSSACGSDFFMAPEVWHGPQKGYQGKNADVWSISACLWAIVDRVYFKDSKTSKKLLGVYFREKPKSEAIPLGEAQLNHPVDLVSYLYNFKKTSKSGENIGWSGDDKKFRNIIAAALHKDSSKRPSVNSLLEELSGSLPVAVENRKRGAPKSLSLSLRKYALGTRKRRPLTDVIPYYVNDKGVKISFFGAISTSPQKPRTPKVPTRTRSLPILQKSPVNPEIIPPTQIAS